MLTTPLFSKSGLVQGNKQGSAKMVKVVYKEAGEHPELHPASYIQQLIISL